MKKLLLAALLFALPGCAGTIHELAADGAIVGVTGFWASVGGAISPTSAMPIPSVSVGYGTIWRIGNHDNVKVLVNSNAGAGGTAQLDITASNIRPGAAGTAARVTIP